MVTLSAHFTIWNYSTLLFGSTSENYHEKDIFPLNFGRWCKQWLSLEKLINNSSKSLYEDEFLSREGWGCWQDSRQNKRLFSKVFNYLSSMCLVHHINQKEEGKIVATFKLSRDHSFTVLYIVLHHPQPISITTLFSYFNPPLWSTRKKYISIFTSETYTSSFLICWK